MLYLEKMFSMTITIVHLMHLILTMIYLMFFLKMIKKLPKIVTFGGASSPLTLTISKQRMKSQMLETLIIIFIMI